MNNKLIRLTESDLHRIVKQSVKKVLNEENTYTDENGEEYDDTSILVELEMIYEHYYTKKDMNKSEVIETLQWIKNIGADGVSLIREYENEEINRKNEEIKRIEKLTRDLLNLYQSV
jgi:hypothetical protein